MTTMASTSPDPSRPAGEPLRVRRPHPGWTWNDVNLVLDIALVVIFVGLCFAALAAGDSA
jgi:hypothetical protein